MRLPMPERVFVYGKPVDMRKSFDGLYELVGRNLGENPASGDLFLFINRNRNYIKGLLWDRTGYLLVAKRLESGKFRMRNTADKVVIEPASLRKLLDGVPVGGTEISTCKTSDNGHLGQSPTDDPRGGR